MRIADSNESFSENGTAIALGNFDGVHIAHTKLINMVLNAKGAKSLVFTFKPHPLRVLGKDFLEITVADKKEKLIKELNPDILFYQRCDRDFLKMPAEAFVKEVLVKRLGASYIAAGYNCSFGEGGKGNVGLLKDMGEKFGFFVDVLDKIEVMGIDVSSTNIRSLIKDGKIETANALLGRKFSIEGKVVEGKKLGRKIGFPTANIIPQDGIVLPKYGVYKTMVGSKKSITNVGVNPTVNDGSTRIETHIIDYDGEIYGDKIEVNFLEFVRPEIKFANVEDLKKQIEKDFELISK